MPAELQFKIVLSVKAFQVNGCVKSYIQVPAKIPQLGGKNHYLNVCLFLS